MRDNQRKGITSFFMGILFVLIALVCGIMLLIGFAQLSQSTVFMILFAAMTVFLCVAVICSEKTVRSAMVIGIAFTTFMTTVMLCGIVTTISHCMESNMLLTIFTRLAEIITAFDAGMMLYEMVKRLRK